MRSVKLNFPSEVEINSLLEQIYTLNYSKSTIDIVDGYQSLKSSELKEYHLNLLKVRLNKNQILKSIPKELKREIFRFDLDFALKKYSTKDFHIAELMLNELITSYGYSNMSDILFLRGESLLQIDRFTESL